MQGGYCTCYDWYEHDGEECVKSKYCISNTPVWSDVDVKLSKIIKHKVLLAKWLEECQLDGGGMKYCEENMLCEQIPTVPNRRCECATGTTWDFFANYCVSTHGKYIVKCYLI